jgi:hypothetical protein
MERVSHALSIVDISVRLWTDFVAIDDMMILINFNLAIDDWMISISIDLSNSL